jgi:hypothetical protein
MVNENPKQPVQINLSRRFVKLTPGIDNFPKEIGIKLGELSLVCIGRTLDGNDRLYHEDGVYDFAKLIPSDNGYCLAEILHTDGKTEQVKFSYSEAGILLPMDPTNFSITHPGSLRRPHPNISTRKVLESMVHQDVLINDDKPEANNTYTMRKIQSCNGVGYNASFVNSQGQAIDAKYDYKTLAGVLVPSAKFPSGLTVPMY